MAKKVMIIGGNPIANSFIQQYERHGMVVEWRQCMPVEGLPINDYDELCLLGDEGEDEKAITLLSTWGAEYDLDMHKGEKLVCHLMLKSNHTLQMLQVCDFCNVIRNKIDVYPFTIDEVWSRSILLDYEPITIHSEKHVHLVIFGMDEISEMVAIQAAHVSHFPNYIRNHTLRTRITLIDVEADRKGREIRKKYQHLFDNSYYRVVIPSKEMSISEFHKPLYEGQREDFVDVEWEFVEAESWDSVVREKLCLWAKDKKQLLTVVMAFNDVNKNQSESLLLPQDLYDNSVPIHIYNRLNDGYDVLLPLVRMAKNVNYIYDCCYRDNVEDWKGILRYAVEIDKEERENSWAKLSNVKRMSSIYNAMTIPSKMRSIGLAENEWDKFYDIPQQDIEIMAQVEHNRWSVEELLLGFRPCTDEEQKIIAADVERQKVVYKARKVHYDLRAYNDLRPDGTGKPVQVYDICLSSCLPLITKAFDDEKGGEI